MFSLISARSQVGLERVFPVDMWKLQGFHKIGCTGKGVVIAILDGGVYTKHNLINGSLIKRICPPNSTDIHFSLDFIKSKRNPFTQHGTSVAAIAGCLLHKDKTPAGIAPDATFLICRVSERKDPNWEAVYTALKYLLYRKKKLNEPLIICMSFGSVARREEIAGILQELADNKVICVASAGNKGCRQQGALFPACWPTVLSVGALTPGGNKSDINPKSLIDVYAYGENFWLPKIGEEKDCFMDDGTSLAAPMVAGFLALVLQCVQSGFPKETRDFPEKTRNKVIADVVRKFCDIAFLKTFFARRRVCDEELRLIFVMDFLRETGLGYTVMRVSRTVDEHPAVKLIKDLYSSEFDPFGSVNGKYMDIIS